MGRQTMREAVIEALRDGYPMEPWDLVAEVQARTGCTAASVRGVLTRLRREGRIIHHPALYQLGDEGR